MKIQVTYLSAAAAVLVSFISQPANGQVLISDNFSFTAGVELNGQAPEVGSGTWLATTGVNATVYSGSNTVNGGSPNAGIGFTAPGGLETLTVSQSITTGNNVAWVAMALRNGVSASPFDGSGLSAVLYSSGLVQLFDQGFGNLVYSDTPISGFSTSTPYQFDLKYNVLDGTAELFVDSVALFEVAPTVTFTGTLSAAGLYTNGTGLDASVGDFSVVATVPEPSTFVLLLLAVAASAIMLKNRRGRTQSEA